MSLNYLPGRPNDSYQTTCQAFWQNHTLFAYCSGNNLIISSNHFTRLQTIYIDTDCIAVDINSSNGFIAVAFSNHVHIYKPIHQVMKNPKWVLCCKIHHDESDVNCLKWGSSTDIIIGSQYLSFWNINDEYGSYKPILLWNKRQPKPVYMCNISEDSQFVSSIGKFDKTVKFWRRNTISANQVIFHLTLLPHPNFVTSLKWKRLAPHSDSAEEFDLSQTLYTLCSDKKLRVWSCHQSESGNTVQQWGTIDMNEDQTFCIILDSCILRDSIKETGNLPVDFKEIPDIVVFSTPSGECEVHSVENLSKNPPRPLIQRKLFTKYISKPSFISNPQYLYFAEAQSYGMDSEMISLAVHDLKGFIRHSTIDAWKFLNEEVDTPGTIDQIFTGHNKSIQRLIRSSDGEALLTISRFSENCVWCPQKLSKGMSLWMKNMINTESPIKDAVVHEKGNLVIVLLENSKIQAWCCPNTYHDMEREKAYIISETVLHSPNNENDIVLMLNIPELKHNHNRHFIALFYTTGDVKAFEVSTQYGIIEVESDPLDVPKGDIHHISCIDPVHASFYSNRPLIAMISKSGLTRTFKAIVENSGRKIKWLLSHTITTGINNALNVRGSSTGKVCIVDSLGKQITFWDLKRGVLEYEESFDDVINDIDWTSTQFRQSIVSIGFTGYALLYTQLRYDYTNNSPSYLPMEKIDITEHTSHNIGDSIWMKDGTFVVASGNQFYIKDKSLDLSDPFVSRSIGSRKILSNDIIHLNSVLNGPLPVYHPQFLIQSLYNEKLSLVKELILRLFLEMRKFNFESKEIAELPSDLNIDWNKFTIRKDKYYPVENFSDPYPIFNSTVANSLNELLTKNSLPYMTRHQQITLMTVVEAVDDMAKNEDILDYNALLFLLGVKLYHSHKNVQNGLVMRDVSWALHSDNKELLLSSMGSNITSWQSAREYRLAYWTKEDDLIRIIEEIAKFEFSIGETRNPSKCAIFYLALKKKQILLSLWRISVGHPEQQKMLKFLNNDFTDPRWKTAALKNAFVLLSKHRYMDAACFFLLSGSLKDCINVLSKQLKDNDLAIAVCRVYELDNGPILAEFLSSHFFPTAIANDDRWMASFIYWKLRKQDLAIRALVTPPVDLENNSTFVKKEDCVNKSFLVDDPALLVLYAHLRKRNIRYLKGALEVEKKAEFNLILRVCDIYCRMGCNYLAVSLVKNWKFIETKKSTDKIQESPDKAGTYSGIDSMTTEPISTTRARPSLFDKFDENSSSKTTTKTMASTSQRNIPKNALGSFLEKAQPSNNCSNNLLNDIQTPILSATPKSLLDDFQSSAPKIILDDFTTPSSISSSKNLLDDFTSNVSHSNPKNLLDDFEFDTVTPPKSKTQDNSSKPKSLLDSFM